MKKTPSYEADGMLPEYDFDYNRARPNRFSGMTDEKRRRLILLDPDTAGVFGTSESVNRIPRAIIAAMPENAVKNTHGENRQKTENTTPK